MYVTVQYIFFLYLVSFTQSSVRFMLHKSSSYFFHCIPLYTIICSFSTVARHLFPGFGYYGLYYDILTSLLVDISQSFLFLFFFMVKTALLVAANTSQ